MRRLVLVVTAVLAMPASAEAGTLLSVPAAGGRATVVGRAAGAYFGQPCWRADGSLTARVERAKRNPAIGVFRRGAAPRWRAVDEYAHGADFAPGCKLVAETIYGFEQDPQFDGGILIRETSGEAIKRVKSYRWPEGETLAWSRDGTRLAIAMSERGHDYDTVRIVDVAERRVIARVKGAESITLYPGAFSPDGGALVYEDGTELRIFDVATRRSRVLAGDRDGRNLRAPSWSPKGDRIAAVNYGGGIELLDPALGYGPTIPTSDVWTESLAWSPDGETLALQFSRPNESEAIPRHGLALVAPAADAQLRRILEPVPYLSPPVWSPDGTALAVSRRG
jgi:hypothetical protein